MQLGNGHWESTVFNNRLQPTEIKLGTTQGTSNYLSLAYSYGTTNNNGNILSQTIVAPASACWGTACMDDSFTAVQTYTYDSLNRIKSAVETVDQIGAWNQTFNYDRFGNRKFDEANTSMPASFANPNITNPTISPSNNRITSSGWSYDLSGNTLTDAGAQTYVYDGENKMVKASNGSGTLGEYFYDGDGKRVKKIAANDGGTTIFVYDAAGKLVAEYSYAVASIENAKVAYLTNDHLGSPRINTDRDGNVTSRHDYHPFGEEILTSQREGHSDYTPDSIRKQFTGYERDTESTLDFGQARYYSSLIGRFYSVDPENAGATEDDPQSWNGYAYSRNNPVLFSDPDGEEYKICDTEGNCVTHSDKSVLNGQKERRDLFQETGRDGDYDSGNILNEDGSVLGTYERTSIDPEYKFVYGVADNASKKAKVVAGAAIGAVVLGGCIGTGTCAAVGAAVAAGAKAVLKSSLKYSKKIQKQMPERGWSKDQIEATVKNPHTTAKTTYKGTGESATAYINKDGSYVVVKNATQEIIQVSNKNKEWTFPTDWKWK